jgi:hypothetical protein
MTVEEYIELFMPAIVEAAELAQSFESKYGSGLSFSDFDKACGAGHLISSIKGLDNPDGKTHAVAALVRTIKAVLKEVN